MNTCLLHGLQSWGDAGLFLLPGWHNLKSISQPMPKMLFVVLFSSKLSA